MPPKSIQKEFLCRGMALSLPPDAKAELKHKYLQNIRVTSDGVLESRPRLQDFLDLGASSDLVHSIRKLIDKASGNSNYIIGAGEKLFSGNVSPLNEIANGFSGRPLSIVNFRPEEAIETYAYISDENKMLKLSANDVLAGIGLDAPTKPVGYTFEGTARKVLDAITAATEPTWTVTNGAKSVITRINTTISQVIADGVLPNFVSIIPTTFNSAIQPGAILTIDSNDEYVESVIPTGLAAGVTTIAGISYEAGTSGICHITLGTPVTEIYRNSILLLNASEYVRVLEVTKGNDGIPVIKTSTTGTFAVGNSVQGFASFRIETSNTYTAGDVIFADALKDTIAAASISDLTKVANYDLTFADGEPLSENSIVHISLRASNPSNISEIQIQIAFDTGFLDYIYYAVSPNFLTSNVSQEATAPVTLQSALQKTDILNAARFRELNPRMMYGVDSLYEQYGYYPEQYNQIASRDTSETALGSLAWSEIAIPISKFTRVGSDPSKSRKDIKAIRVSINALDAVEVTIDSIWVGGASGLDSVGSSEQALLPYNYVYRFRHPATKNISNWSPPIREGLLVKRSGITISIPANALPVDYKVDIARIGGQVNDFRMLASIFNDGSTFTDNISDDLIVDNQAIARASTEFSIGDFDYFRPFAILDTPKSGICNVVGTELTVTSGDNLDLSYPRGTQILVDGNLTSFYSNPSSATKVSLEKNLDTLIGVKFEIREPLLTGKPLPIMAGTYKGVIFGAGDVNAAGTVYWLDPNSPDTMSDVNKIEVSTPSEPIMAIVIYDDFVFIYTTKRSYTLTAFNSNGYLDFSPRENANSGGIISRYGVCVARAAIYQLSDDGIYRSEGVGNPQSITDTDLHSLFPHNGIAPQAISINGAIFYPPDYSHIDDMRLYSTEDHIFWRFLDIEGKYVCLVYDTRLEGWVSLDTFSDNIVGAIYKEEDEDSITILVGQEGIVKQYGDGSSDDDEILSAVVPFTEDLGDFRSLKQFYEIAIDAIVGDSPIGNALTIRTRLNNLDIVIPDFIFPDNTNRDIVIQNINNGQGQIARNISQLLFWPLDAGTKLYRESIYYTPYNAEIITNKNQEFGDDLMYDKFWQGIIIDADTFGEDKELKFYDDDMILKATITINHSERKIKSYSFDIPFISHKITRGSTDNIEWVPYKEQYVFDREPELAKVWESQFTSFGANGFKQLKSPTISVASTSDVILKLTLDNETLPDYTIPNTGGVKKSYEFHIAPRKWRLLKLRLESTSPFRFYKNDLEINIREWNSQNDFQAIKPFGTSDNETGVQI